ncbi:glycosyltransferase family 4 protein [Dyadobacter sandarakinus]|uniref:Glycosyltransferase family 4 protein n=1 Tax=Dyadobacter sandarakinus TaxID=2747268 RepID=A0ABX7I2K3_9BACT|nr:glycosyltransferase family 4 protein [Dyadobacter sandarakinus]QRQ99462.1 glycosyltransferase family 4 protein [Dyadobacter sandarakinus]
MENNLLGKHILIVVENLPVPFDRRVWQEANTLKENGAKVSIICPKMKGYTKSRETIDGIEIYRHPLPVEASGALGYLLEYSAALFWEFTLALRIFFKKRFHVIQGCNPPDLIFLVALPFKLFGVKYVFDHHDINPELYEAKFEKQDAFYKLMVLFEKLTFRTANASIATNESYKSIAVERGGMSPDKVTVIRSGPKLDRLRITAGNQTYKKGRNYLVGYLGVIGEQEGIDLLLEAFRLLVDRRKDVQLAIVGGGTSVESLKALSIEKGLGDYVDFYGRVSDELMVDILNTTDICVNPDKPLKMNNLSTMNKIMEYMALKKPIVQFDLKEGKFSAREASLYATSVPDFADKMDFLLSNAAVREQMGNYGYNRVVTELSWEFESKKLIDFYKRLLK